MVPMKVRLPRDRGITGHAISRKEVLVVKDGEQEKEYLAEVDNAAGVAVIRNMMIGPCFDTSGTLRGLIQLVNKEGENPISENERIEFVNLCPTVAEIIKQADEVQFVGDLSSNIFLHLYNSRDSMISSTEAFEARDFQKIYTCINQINNRIESYMEQRRNNTLKEKMLAEQVFATIREEKE